MPKNRRRNRIPKEEPVVVDDTQQVQLSWWQEPLFARQLNTIDEDLARILVESFLVKADIVSLQWIFDRFPSVKDPNVGDKSLLERAIRQCRKRDRHEMLKFLLEAKCDVNIKEQNGQRPLHHAVSIRDSQAVEIFIKYGADVNVHNNAGLSPLHMSIMDRKSAIVDILEGAGAEFTTLNIGGRLLYDKKSLMRAKIDTVEDINEEDPVALKIMELNAILYQFAITRCIKYKKWLLDAIPNIKQIAIEAPVHRANVLKRLQQIYLLCFEEPTEIEQLLIELSREEEANKSSIFLALVYLFGDIDREKTAKYSLAELELYDDGEQELKDKRLYHLACHYASYDKPKARECLDKTSKAFKNEIKWHSKYFRCATDYNHAIRIIQSISDPIVKALYRTLAQLTYNKNVPQDIQLPNEKEAAHSKHSKLILDLVKEIRMVIYNKNGDFNSAILEAITEFRINKNEITYKKVLKLYILSDKLEEGAKFFETEMAQDPLLSSWPQVSIYGAILRIESGSISYEKAVILIKELDTPLLGLQFNTLLASLYTDIILLGHEEGKQTLDQNLLSRATELDPTNENLIFLRDFKENLELQVPAVPSTKGETASTTAAIEEIDRSSTVVGAVDENTVEKVTYQGSESNELEGEEIQHTTAKPDVLMDKVRAESLEHLKELGLEDENEAEKAIYSTELWEQLREKHYAKLKAAIKISSFIPDTYEHTGWEVQGRLYKVGDEGICKVTGQYNVYAMIAPTIELEEEELQAFQKALGSFIHAGVTGDGVKYLRQNGILKLIELRTDRWEKRPFTERILKSPNGDRLLYFDQQGNHQTVKRAVRKSKGIEYVEPTARRARVNDEENDEEKVSGIGANGVTIGAVLKGLEALCNEFGLGIASSSVLTTDSLNQFQYVTVVDPLQEGSGVANWPLQVSFSGTQKDASDGTCAYHALRLLYMVAKGSCIQHHSGIVVSDGHAASWFININAAEITQAVGLYINNEALQFSSSIQSFMPAVKAELTISYSPDTSINNPVEITYFSDKVYFVGAAFANFVGAERAQNWFLSHISSERTLLSLVWKSHHIKQYIIDGMAKIQTLNCVLQIIDTAIDGTRALIKPTEGNAKQAAISAMEVCALCKGYYLEFNLAADLYNHDFKGLAKTLAMNLGITAGMSYPMLLPFIAVAYVGDTSARAHAVKDNFLRLYDEIQEATTNYQPLVSHDKVHEDFL